MTWTLDLQPPVENGWIMTWSPFEPEFKITTEYAKVGVLPMPCLMCTNACRCGETDVVCENTECFDNKKDSDFAWSWVFVCYYGKNFIRKEKICSVNEKVLLLLLKFIGKHLRCVSL